MEYLRSTVVVRVCDEGLCMRRCASAAAWCWGVVVALLSGEQGCLWAGGCNWRAADEGRAFFMRRTLRERWVWRHLRTLTPTPLPGGEGLELPGCVVRG